VFLPWCWPWLCCSFQRPVLQWFSVSAGEGLFNLSLGYGLLARVEDRDKRLIAVANGGTAESANYDDGTLNYDRGIVSNMVRGTGELAVKGGLGGFMPGAMPFMTTKDRGVNWSEQS